MHVQPVGKIRSFILVSIKNTQRNTVRLSILRTPSIPLELAV